MSKDIALALGGGGAKGHAHIGVLRVLEREGYNVRVIAGTSAGGVWGSFYAAGYTPEQILEQVERLNWPGMFQRSPNDGPAMMGLSGVERLLRSGLDDCAFEDLQIPFAVTAVDLDRAELVVLNSGKLVDAILATIAIPGLFPTQQVNGRNLIDGGILDPVPAGLARAMAPDLPVVAVVLSPPMDAWVSPTPPRLLNSLPFLTNYLSRLRIAQAFNTFLHSIDIAGAMLTELRLAVDQPEVIIRPPVPHIGLMDPVDIREVARLGEIAAEQALPEIERALSWRARLWRKISRPKVRPVRIPTSADLRLPAEAMM